VPALPVLLLVLALTPVGLLALHMAIHRALTAGKRRISGYGSAIRAIALGFVVILAVAVQLGILRWNPEGIAESGAALIYVTAVYGSMSLLYINAINVAETSLTAHTLLEISWAGTVGDQQLFSKYSAAHMVQARMDRLIALGQIHAREDRYHLSGHWLLRFAQAVALWRSVIGMPAPVLLKEHARR
jgi:hypothetical protein